MELNNIELPASVVVELYQNSLSVAGSILPASKIAAKPIEIEPATEQVVAWKSLGDNRKNILIIISSPGSVHIADNELSFLTGILGACKLNMADVAIVNHYNYQEATYKELTNYFKSKIVFLFDIEPASFGLPMSFPHYQIQSFAGSSFLYSVSLKDLENDKIEKSKLWISLKRLFNLQ